MTSLNISLPEALKEYVEGQVATGDWGTPSEYVRELIRQDKERRLGKSRTRARRCRQGTENRDLPGRNSPQGPDLRAPRARPQPMRRRRLVFS